MPTKINKCVCVCVLIYCFIAGSSNLLSQTPANDENSERRARAEADVKELEAMLKRAELEAKQFDNLKKQIDAMRADVSSKSLNAENEISAIESLKCLSLAVWSSLPSGEIEGLWIGNNGVRQSISEYELVSNQLTTFVNAYEEFWEKYDSLRSNEAVPQSLPPLLSVFAATMSAFKTDLALEGASVTIGKDMFISAFGTYRPSQHGSIKVFIADRIFPSNITNLDIVKKLRAIQEAYLNSKSLRSLLDLETAIRTKRGAEREMDRSTVAEEQKKKLSDVIDKLDAETLVLRTQIEIDINDDEVLSLIGSLKKLQQMTEKFSAQIGFPLDTLPNAQSENKILELMRAELIKKTKSDRHYWIEFSEVKSGGTVRTRNNLIAGLFKPSWLVTFSGGSAVSYVITGQTGEILWSGTMTYNRPFLKHSEIKGQMPSKPDSSKTHEQSKQDALRALEKQCFGYEISN